MFLNGFAFSVLSTFVPLFIKSTRLKLNVGLFYSTAAISGCLVRLVTGKASDHLGRGLLITISLVCYLLLMLLLWQANSIRTLLLAALIEGAGSGMLISTVATLVADRSRVEERGRIYALCVTGFDVGIVLAGPILGGVAAQIGYRNIFGFTAFVAGIALLIFVTRSSEDLSHSLCFAFGCYPDIYALNQD